MAKQITSLADCSPQKQNANRHTPRGMGMLDGSIGQDGWIGAVTVATNGETFDGSARVEIGAPQFPDAIVVHTDGSKPLIHVRDDIPTAKDPRAKRLGLAANRIASVNLDFDPIVLEELSQELDLSSLWSKNEWNEALENIADFGIQPAESLTEKKDKMTTCPECGYKFHL